MECGFRKMSSICIKIFFAIMPCTRAYLSFLKKLFVKTLLRHSCWPTKEELTLCKMKKGKRTQVDLSDDEWIRIKPLVKEDVYYGPKGRAKHSRREMLKGRKRHILVDHLGSGQWIHPAFFPPSFFQQLTSHHLQGKRIY